MRGSSAMPQIGQLPGSSRTISGCIGQVHSVLTTGNSGSLWCVRLIACRSWMEGTSTRRSSCARITPRCNAAIRHGERNQTAKFLRQRRRLAAGARSLALMARCMLHAGSVRSLWLGVIAAAACVAGACRGSEPPSVEQRALAEFRGAYPAGLTRPAWFSAPLTSWRRRPSSAGRWQAAQGLGLQRPGSRADAADQARRDAARAVHE